MAYPTTIDPAIWQIALDAIGGKFDGTAETFYELWEFAGYVAGQAAPYTPPSAAATAVKRDFMTVPMVDKFKAVGAINWASLLALLLPILEQILPLILTPAA
jgi:hypothetical protein